MKNKLVLLRHGESLWNQAGLFTGWTDIDLSSRGIRQAKHAGQIMRDHGLIFDHSYTSVLTRAIKTLYLATAEMNQYYLPVTKAWQLNERHYGDLQGLSKKQMVRQVGAEQVALWRRSYSSRPPKISKHLYQQFIADPRYQELSKNQMPWSESLADTYKRVLPYYLQEIEPRLRAGQNILITAHGNSLRALIKYLDNISDEAITELEIAYSEPLVYELDFAHKQHRVTNRRYLHEHRARKSIKKKHRHID